MNVWAGRGAPPPPHDAAGLVDFQILLPDSLALDSLLDRLRSLGHAPEPAASGVGWAVRARDGTVVVLRAE